MGARRRGREIAIQMLYQWDTNREPVAKVLESFHQLGDHPVDVWEFAGKLVKGTLRHLEKIDSLISRHADSWRLTRMATVDRNVLRMAVYEFLCEDTPRKVVINEALEVTRKFSTPEAVQFVNGVLDAVRLDLDVAPEVP